MKVKEVIALAAANLGREDLAQAVDTYTQPTGELLSLLRCYNLVENEVALDYFPLRKEEVLAVADGCISYRAFSSAPVDIIKITCGGEEGIAFELFPDHLKIAGEYAQVRVLYAYAPDEKQWSDDGAFTDRISARLLSYGVTCEFCLSRGQFTEASIWQKRYQDALRAASMTARKRAIRSRRWV